MKAYYLFLALVCFGLNSTLRAQTEIESNIPTNQVDLQIIDIDYRHESLRGLKDGKIIISLNRNIPFSNVDLKYDFNIKGNHQSFSNIKTDGKHIVLHNVAPGRYLNFEIVSSAHFSNSIKSDLFAEINHGKKREDQSKTFPCVNLEWTNCDGSNGTAYVLQNNTYYNDKHSATPCGFQVAENCNVVNQIRWHCLNGDVSNPPPLNAYRKSSHTELNISPLQAARINYIIENYNYNDIGVSNAIWKITNTGGNSNSVYLDAINNVNQPDGSEHIMTFLKSLDPNYQDMIEFSNGSSLGDFIWSDLNNNGIQEAGEPGIPNVEVNLIGTDEAGNSVSKTLFTNQDGYYNFLGLDAGVYRVKIVAVPEAYTIVSRAQGNNDAVDSDFYAFSGITPSIYLGTDEDIPTIDCGLHCGGNITISDLDNDKTYECGGSPIFDIPDVLNYCGGFTLNFETDTINGGCAGPNYIRLWTATDDLGNTATTTQTISAVDNVAPELFGLPDETTMEFECGSDPFWPIVTATDNCSNVELTCEITPGSKTTCVGDGTTKIWTATDECGNTTTGILTMIPVDSTPPIIENVEDDGTYICGEDPKFSDPTSIDECTISSIDYIDVTSPGSCAGPKITRTWTATDACGNMSTAAQTMEPLDMIAPVISGVGDDGNFECGDLPNFSIPSAADNCSAVSLSFIDMSSGDCTSEGITRVWTAIDECGNSSTASQTMTTSDNEGPVFAGVGAAGEYQCGESPVFSDPTAIDNCSEVSLSFVDTPTNGSCAGTGTTRTWTATDDCGNTTTAWQTLEPVDNEGPIFSGVGNDGEYLCGDTPVFSNPTANDNCSNVTITFIDNPTIGLCAGTGTTRTWTATDDCGNTTTASQTMEAVDIEGPVFSGVGNDGEYLCDQSPSFSNPTAIDNCSNPTITFVDTPTIGSCAGSGTTRTWTATDECGNTTIASQTLEPVDIEGPVFSGVGNDGEYFCGDMPVFSNPTAIDNCSAVTLSFVDTPTVGSCAGNATTRTWTAIDECGNTTTTSQTMVPIDFEGPIFAGVGAAGEYLCGESPVFSDPTAIDNCSEVSLSFVDTPTNGSCAGTGITRTWTATDECGNTTTAWQTMEPVDNEGPVLSGVGNDGEYLCGDTPVFSNPTANDNCSNVTITFIDNPTIGLCAGTGTTRTWTATDDCGNTTTASQTMEAVDIEGPVISGVGNDGEYLCDQSPSFSNPTAIDNCSNPTITFVDTPTIGSCAGSGTTRTWTATDECGNTTTATQTLEPVDIEGPEINGIGANGTYLCGETPQFSTPSVEDNCSISSVSFSDEINTLACVTSVTRTWIAIDECGNETMAKQTMSTQDFSPPVIIGVEPSGTFPCGSQPTFSNPIAQDNCGGVSLSFVDTQGTSGCANLSWTRTWTAVDDCGNVSIETQSFTAFDEEAPIISGIGPDGSFDCNTDPMFSEPTVSDNCGPVTMSFIDNVHSSNCAGDGIVRVWTAIDGCGNTTIETQVFILIDTIAPTVENLGLGGTYDCDSIPVFSTPNAYDDCSFTTTTFFDYPTEGGCAGPGIRREWVFVDNCGNQAHRNEIFTPIDTIAPILIGVGKDSIYCIEDGLPEFSNPSAEDNCTFNPIITYKDTVFGQNTTRTWTVVDSCGNASVKNQTFVSYDCGSISNFVWNDANGNGIQEANESGIADLKIHLFNALNNELLASTRSSANGEYKFKRLFEGSYFLQFGIPNELVPTQCNVGDDELDSDIGLDAKTNNLTIVEGQNIKDLDAGFTIPSKIGNQVWLDSGNIPDVLDDHDKPLEGVTVYLYDAEKEMQIKKTFTDAEGKYVFFVPPGDYKLGFVKDGFELVKPDAGQDNEDSDVDPTTGFTEVFQLGFDRINLNLDAGFIDKTYESGIYESISAEWISKETKALIEWKVSEDFVAQSCILERTNNLNADFNELGFINIEKDQYSFIYEDRSIIESGTYYYRVKHKAANGLDSYSSIAELEVDMELSNIKYLEVYPNPATDRAYFDIKLERLTPVSIYLYQMDGKIISVPTKFEMMGIGEHRLEIDLTQFSQGVYIVNFLVGDDRIVKKISVIE